MKVRDVMDTDLVCVTPEHAVQQAAALMAEHGYTALPVVDAKGAIVGMITELDLLKLLLPDFLEDMDELGFLPADMAVGRYSFDEISCIPVARAMRTDLVHVVTEDEPVMEAIRIMVRHRVRHLAVVMGTQVIGMLRSSDIVREIIHPSPEDCE